MQLCRFKEQEREELDLLGPPHPGEILREDLLPRLKLSRKELAAELGVSRSTVSKLMNERRRISRKLAAGLARLSGTSALYWLLLQAHHDAWSVERDGESVGPKKRGELAWYSGSGRRREGPGSARPLASGFGWQFSTPADK